MKKRSKEECSHCGKIRQVNVRKNGKPICSQCCGILFYKARCSMCGDIKPVASRKGPLCSACLRKKNPEQCQVCKRILPVAGRRDEKAICANCKVMTDHRLMFRNYKRGAKKRNLDFVLDVDEFEGMTSMKCAYCGKKEENGILGGVDRVDNSLGYVPGNCVPCCATCNRMKSSMSEVDFISHVVSISKHRSKRKE